MPMRNVKHSLVVGTKSWQTTAAGVAQWFVACLPQLQTYLDGNPETMPDWNVIAASTAVLIGLLFARDGDKRSEKVGA